MIVRRRGLAAPWYGRQALRLAGFVDRDDAELQIDAQRLPRLLRKGYCDGQPCGLFRTKREFELFVECEPNSPPFNEACIPAIRAEAASTWEGNQLLHKLIDNLKKNAEG